MSRRAGLTFYRRSDKLQGASGIHSKKETILYRTVVLTMRVLELSLRRADEAGAFQEGWAGD